ncbi:hypothetical protein [Actinomadura sp. WMMB 499]|uniref:hypothetical protein n=1 Tax=Actinomadura sp. WMMB 499 TaxID=1219491 RepID=UPI001246B676|nr:hypothetical protein [Actinomadura sp. WMMB 499]QFG24584.1 hypothetical protein F7P10_29055 [Actinomadura sp. WMMB 499]
MSDLIQVVPEWALWGKEPNGLSYRVLRCSDGRLSSADFTQIMQHHSTGTHSHLPQVTLNWARDRAKNEQYIGLAVQRWAQDRDHTGRKIAITRYCALPYSQLPDAVSYETVFHALTDWEPPPDDAPAAMELPVLSPEALASRVDEYALGVAGLLFALDPVHIVPSGRVPTYLERLQFLDVVAALLPYGLRTRLSAATWVSSTSQNRIRLAFTAHAGEDAQGVRWGVTPSFAGRWESIAHAYADLLGDVASTEDRAAELIRGLAAQREPMGFTPSDARRSLELLRAQVRGPRRPAGTSQGDGADFVAAAEALHACRHAVVHIHRTTFISAVARLRRLQNAGFAADERRRLWEIAVDAGLPCLPSSTEDDPELDELYEACLRLGYGTALDLDNVHQIENDLGTDLPPQLLRVMARLAVGERSPHLAIAIRLGWDVTGLVRNVDANALVHLAVNEERGDVLRTVLAELRRRSRDDHATPVVHALMAHGHLARPVERFYAGIDEQAGALRELLSAVYGGWLNREQFARILQGGGPNSPRPPLLLAALSLYRGPDARDLLVEVFLRGFLGATTPTYLSADLRRVVDDALARHSWPPAPTSRYENAHDGGDEAQRSLGDKLRFWQKDHGPDF